MNLAELQAELLHFASERDWHSLHTPKNLTTALMVRAAGLAEIFQWRTPEESQRVQDDAATRQRIGDEVANVLVHLLQVAHHCQVDVPKAVRGKLERDAVEFPAKRKILRKQPPASAPSTHVLLDYENVQPSDSELRSLVPDADQVWVFHGPHQRDVAKRFASFGAGATAVPVSKTGKNALDFHLSFYMGYIASRNPDSAMVVVANDKGYEPMLEHARAMGFEVRRQSHGEVNSRPAIATANKAIGKKLPGKNAVSKPAAAKQATPKKAVARKVAAATLAPAVKTATVASSPGAKGAKGTPKVLVPDAVATIKKLTDALRKMGDKRPTKPVSLRRSIKSALGAGATDDDAQKALDRLIGKGVVKLDPTKGASYPMFGAATLPKATPRGGAGGRADALQALVDGITPENRHAAVDVGPARGAESS